MQKLKYGAGSVSLRQIKRKDGSIRRYYQGRIYIEGKQICVYGSTQAEVLSKLKKLREQRKKTPAKILPQTPKLYGEWLDKWIDLFKAGKLRADYKAEFLKRVEIIRRQFGNVRLRDLSALELQKFINSFSKTNTAVKIYDVLNGSLQKAEDVGIIPKNPCRALERPTYDKQRRRAFEVNEQAAMLEALEGKHNFAFYFLCCTGLRVGEFLALDKSDVDFEKHVIIISKSKSLKSGNNGSTKTAAGVRKVYFTDELFEYFDINLLGKFTYSGIKKAFSKALKKLNLTGVSVTHSCRHTYASMLACLGIPAKVIQAQMGHASIVTTMDVYADLLYRGNSAIYKYIEGLKSTLISTLILM